MERYIYADVCFMELCLLWLRYSYFIEINYFLSKLIRIPCSIVEMFAHLNIRKHYKVWSQFIRITRDNFVLSDQSLRGRRVNTDLIAWNSLRSNHIWYNIGCRLHCKLSG